MEDDYAFCESCGEKFEPETGEQINCAYCDNKLKPESGLYNSEEDAPEINFWACDECGHTHMDENQEKELKKKLDARKQ